MCDTIAVVTDQKVLFAKNSDRDPNEAQIPEWHPRARHEPGAAVKCTYLEIPQVDETYGTLISRPFWMWGAEMGTNEHGVTIGNEAVFTNQTYETTGLTGMDLLRLSLERSRTADEATSVLVQLLETHGQGGGCGHEDRSFTYHNSFLIADRERAVVLETAGRKWAVEEVNRGVRTISNGLTIRGFADDYRDRLRSRVAACDVRTALTARLSEGALGAGDLMGVLRSHGETRWPTYRMLNGTLRMPCMHGGGIVASSSSTAGWVSDLGSGTHWITGTSAQCLALFKPVRVGEPVDIGQAPTDRADPDSLWWRHERLARAVMADPELRSAHFRTERDDLENEWISAQPTGAEAFAAGSEALERWHSGVPVSDDLRPWWVKRYWNRRNDSAGVG